MKMLSSRQKLVMMWKDNCSHRDRNAEINI